LPYLKRWLDAHAETSSLRVLFYGQADPRLAGIEFTVPETGCGISCSDDANCDEKVGPSPGWCAIDVNHLHGTDLPASDGEGNWRCFPTGQFCYLQRFDPVGMAGYSIYIYHITQEEANRVRRELGLPVLAGQ
jgi:hypothetical protein